jgi:feruloyl esterase
MTRTRLIARAFVISSAALGIAGCAANTADVSCTVDDIQSVVASDTTIVSATPTEAPAPHCRVEGYVTTTNPGPNQVNFRLQLPDQNWNGRYYFIGLGATAGYVPTDSQIPGGNPILKGFAVAGTDTGHQHRASWSFFGTNPTQGVDHLHRGAHVTAVATQEITRKYYGQDKIYRYHSGCSGGGRMGTEALTRHPEDYDGILLGAPGMGPKFGAETMIAFIHLGQQMNREPGAWLSPAKLQMLDEKVTEQCDALDGATDGIVWEHEACSYDFTTLLCTADDAPDCLTAPELSSVEAILEGPPGPNGPIKAGYPITNIGVWSTFIGAPPPWPEPLTEANLRQASSGYFMGNSLAQAYFGSDYNALKDFKFNDQQQLDAWWDGAKRIGFGNPYSTDINAFKNHGGKVIFWNGVSDPCCHDQDLISYFEQVGEKGRRHGGARRIRPIL